ncbi:thiamine-phosphate synthase [bacterium BMS3Bbin06]|nr:thiamine-phosphate synthase [bacterium BMS3Abin08]GBE34151.1 thiamine-phosphate synthase [bacterium BMS3Bbin06]HDO35103.1 thiamine phosphate synthase [Nitrospirota bacterium]HDY72258.1 thiamine phosphate synthase [Nitrospirota bacterium]
MIDFCIYLVTDRRQLSIPLLEGIEEALKGGIRAIQLREKDLSVRELLVLAAELRELTSRYDARLFINDRVDVAMVVEADGVHLGAGGMPVDSVRRLTGGEMLIGVSTHSLGDAEAAERAGADFITFGPVYETPSKMKYGPPQGPEKLRKVAGNIRIPVFAIGGIKKEKIGEVRDAGARGIALISGILASDSINKETEEYVRSMS